MSYLETEAKLEQSRNQIIDFFFFPPRMGNTPDSASDNLGFRCATNQSKNQKQKKNIDKTEL